MRLEHLYCALLMAVACSESAAGGAPTAADSGVDAQTPAGMDLPAVVSHCGGELELFELPSNPGERGPWPVGARAVTAAGLQAEVWYPAEPGSAAGLEPYTYDLRKYLPPEQQATVTSSTTILQPCDCYRDLPLDVERGPYPVIVFLHGFSGFSGQSLEQMTHWASRGFVVVSADHPSIGLQTFLTGGLGALDLSSLSAGCDLATAGAQTQEAIGMLDALGAPSGDVGFLSGHIDMTRVGAAGHSAGGMAIATLSSDANVRVFAPMAAGGVCPTENVQSSLVLGAMQDSIVAYTTQQNGFSTSPVPKRLVGLANAGHMAFTSFCPIGADEGGILQAAMNAGVVFDPTFLSIVAPLAADGCGADQLAPARGWEVVNFATAGAFEETLLCLPERAAELSRISELFADAVGEYRQEL